ncbi:TetR/AcrR family transcriptional regulator [uncultured Neglectibacter sp.]|uniref:TetR/AcrR family transcriptional regulator n=1 Tax=uncultured Neglectibacter sp. TaxID=1924108 RepID=UPI0034DF694D
MNKSESKYFNTAARMDEAFLTLLAKKDFEFITVKEICEAAGVNRSTFYLHYETISDLLEESVQYINDRFLEYFQASAVELLPEIQDSALDKLVFITPKYLVPYLNYVRDHRQLFRTALQKSGSLRLETVYSRMFEAVFDPILDRFRILPQERQYKMAFYIHGLTGMIDEWLQNDCAESIGQMVRLIQSCVLPHLSRIG